MQADVLLEPSDVIQKVEITTIDTFYDTVQLGDHIAVPMITGGWHHGIFVGKTQSPTSSVIHLESATYKLDPMGVFRGDAAHLAIIYYKEADKAGTLQRAQEAYTRGIYNFLLHNCEHFAAFCATGRSVPNFLTEVLRCIEVKLSIACVPVITRPSCAKSRMLFSCAGVGTGSEH